MLQNMADSTHPALPPHASHSSLVISPNLDALLEHDERTRGALSTLESPGLAGLPPPPRRPRKPRSCPVTPGSSDQLAHVFSVGPETDVFTPTPSDTAMSSIGPGPSHPPSNPYINPPPPFLNTTIYTGRHQSSNEAGAPSTDAEATAQMNSSKLSEPNVTASSTQLLHQQIRDEAFPSPISPYYSGRSEDPDPRFLPFYLSFRPTLPRVEKLLAKGKETLAIFESSSQLSKFRRESGRQSRTTDKHPETPQHSNKRDTSPGPASRLAVAEMRQNDYSIEARSVPIGNVVISAAGVSRPSSMSRPLSGANMRPLLSHGYHNSDSSTVPSRSSSSSNGPPSTDTEPRISISSTVYSPSVYSHSLRGHIHRPPSLHTDLTDLMPTFRYPNDHSLSPSRESFIDLVSPTSPPFTALGEHLDTVLVTPHISDPQPSESFHPPTLTKSDSYPRSPSDVLFLMGTHPSDTSPRPRSPKPPLPTTPKPSFKRSSSAQPRSRNANLPQITTSTSSPPTPDGPHRSAADPGLIPDLLPPPTTNYLGAQERADLIRKSRKLAQVFGQTPSADAFSTRTDEARRPTYHHVPSLLHPTNTGKHRHQHSSASMSDNLQASSAVRPSVVTAWPSTDSLPHLSPTGRRHSAPLSPDDFSFLSDRLTDEGRKSLSTAQGHIEIGTQEGVPDSDWSSHYAAGPNRADSPTSFIDLSEEDVPNDDVSAIISPKKTGSGRGLPYSPSTPSLLESMSAEQVIEDERRRKRDKLAKLHRFLGSRVPADLVLGVSDGGVPLPPPAPSSTDWTSPGLGTVSEDDADTRKNWLRRRRSSSSAAIPRSWSDDMDRLKEDLNEQEKAINVRRAHKMEKVFGVLPPQTLYHTRHSPSPSAPALVTVGSPTSPLSGPFSPVQASMPSLAERNRNQSAYSKMKKSNNRPGTSESHKQLLPSRGSGSIDLDHEYGRQASVYMHYQHSLHSLNDIIDRDDKASLAELHQYLNSDASDSPLQEFTRGRDRTGSVTASIKSERRRSLPAKTSLMSIHSEYSMTSPRPEVTDFQLRRRRAAKLTNFFGVDYRDLIQDVLESIEKGVEEERKRGTLNPEEVQDLLQKLRNLRTKRGGIL